MKKPLYIGNGIEEYLKYFAVPSKLSNKDYFMMGGSEMYKIYNLLQKDCKENKLKIWAIINNNYLHPDWKYDSKIEMNPYSGYFTNEIFEDGIYIGRRND